MKNNKPLVVGYRHTGIITNDIQKSLHFYRNILGFEVLEEFEESGYYIDTITNLKNSTAHFYKLQANDGTVLELLEYPSHKTKPVDVSIINVGVCHIALRVDNSEIAYKRLLEHDVKVLSKPIPSSCGMAKVFFCIDPDNVRIEIVEMLK